MLGDMGRDRMRAADADRQQVAERLRAALDEGRLDLTEYDDRLQRAFLAKTYGDLDRLLADLPNATPVGPEPAAGLSSPSERRRNATVHWLGHVWYSWAKVAVILTVIWMVPLLFGDGIGWYWPTWVVGPWAVLLVLQTVKGLATGAPREHAENAYLERRRRAYRKQWKILEADAIARGELSEFATREQRSAFAAEAERRGDLPPRPPLGDE
jgi:uncharacterized protein DUF1707